MTEIIGANKHRREREYSRARLALLALAVMRQTSALRNQTIDNGDTIIIQGRHRGVVVQIDPRDPEHYLLQLTTAQGDPVPAHRRYNGHRIEIRARAVIWLNDGRTDPDLADVLTGPEKWNLQRHRIERRTSMVTETIDKSIRTTVRQISKLTPWGQ